MGILPRNIRRTIQSIWYLAASAGAAAFVAAVAGAVAGHDGSAGGAAGAVAHVDHRAHGRGGVVDAAVLERRGTRV